MNEQGFAVEDEDEPESTPRAATRRSAGGQPKRLAFTVDSDIRRAKGTVLMFLLVCSVICIALLVISGGYSASFVGSSTTAIFITTLLIVMTRRGRASALLEQIEDREEAELRLNNEAQSYTTKARVIKVIVPAFTIFFIICMFATEGTGYLTASGLLMLATTLIVWFFL